MSRKCFCCWCTLCHLYDLAEFVQAALDHEPSDIYPEIDRQDAETLLEKLS